MAGVETHNIVSQESCGMMLLEISNNLEETVQNDIQDNVNDVSAQDDMVGKIHRRLPTQALQMMDIGTTAHDIIA